MTNPITEAADHARLLTEASTPRLLPPPRRTDAMNDTLLLQMIAEITQPLSTGEGDSPCAEMIPSYNAILSVAKGNHPEDPFLGNLLPIDKGGFVNVSQLLALFALLRFVLDWLQTTRQQ